MLNEGLLVKQQVDALPGGKLTLFVLLSDPFFAATEMHLLAHRLHALHGFFLAHAVLLPKDGTPTDTGCQENDRSPGMDNVSLAKRGDRVDAKRLEPESDRNGVFRGETYLISTKWHVNWYDHTQTGVVDSRHHQEVRSCFYV
jgi:hypothetical protein